ncbi:MAG: hypothetical protein ACXW0J_07900, partial [Nitrososphaeraceae archaeon]
SVEISIPILIVDSFTSKVIVINNVTLSCQLEFWSVVYLPVNIKVSSWSISKRFLIKLEIYLPEPISVP